VSAPASLSRSLQDLSARVLRALDALADGDRSSTWTTLEEASLSLSLAIEQAQELEAEQHQLTAHLERVEARAGALAQQVLKLRGVAPQGDAQQGPA
jgi:hypothetical protein